jgi:hypothetical protein
MSLPRADHAPSPASSSSSASRKKVAFLKVKDLSPVFCEKECNLKVIVMESNAKDEANSGNNSTLLVGDETGCVSLVLRKSLAVHLRLGDIIQIVQTQLVMKNNRIYLWGGKIECLGEFSMLFKESVNMSNITWVKDPQNPDRMVRNIYIFYLLRLHRLNTLFCLRFLVEIHSNDLSM